MQNWISLETVPNVSSASRFTWRKSLIPMGVISRLVRANVLEILSHEFVGALHAKGLLSRRVLYHVMKNAAPSALEEARTRLDPDMLSPKDALQALYDLKKLQGTAP